MIMDEFKQWESVDDFDKNMHGCCRQARDNLFYKKGEPCPYHIQIVNSFDFIQYVYVVYCPWCREKLEKTKEHGCETNT